MTGPEEHSKNQVLAGEQLWQEATGFEWQDPVPRENPPNGSLGIVQVLSTAQFFLELSRKSPERQFGDRSKSFLLHNSFSNSLANPPNASLGIVQVSTIYALLSSVWSSVLMEPNK